MLSEPLGPALLERADAVLVGGSGHYSSLDDHQGIRAGVDFLGDVAASGFPTFASCFGFQCMVIALGGEVIRDEERSEVGTFELELTPDGAADPLFGSLPARFLAQEGHKDRALRLPAGVENLARSERCPYQALRVPGKPVYATQFHPELAWTDQRLRFERYFEEYADLFGRHRAQEILDSIAPAPASTALLARFVDTVLLGLA